MTKAEAFAAIKKADDSAPTAHDKALTSAILPFAHLLNILAVEADQTADKNLKTAEDTLQISKDILAAHHIVVALTRTLRSLTWALLIFTAVLLVATFVLAGIAHSTDERLREIHQQYQEEAAAKKHEAADPKKTEGSGRPVTQ